MSRKPLPLQQIAAFDAAARHLSFSRAARELNVQQPAISRQVGALEAGLGVRLFRRTKPRLTLTDAGALLAEAVGLGLGAIRDGVDRIAARPEEGAIVVNAAIGFTSLYLLPRLAEFQARHPDIKVQVVTRDQNPDFDAESSDLVVVFGTAGLPEAETVRIFAERMVALCRPDLLPGGPLEMPELAGQRLLHMSAPAHIRDWDRFFAGSGLAIAKPAQHDTFLSYMVYLRAIQNGLGIGIGWRPMVDEFLSTGALVKACPLERDTGRGYFCSVTPRGAERAEVAQFLDWIGEG